MLMQSFQPVSEPTFMFILNWICGGGKCEKLLLLLLLKEQLSVSIVLALISQGKVHKVAGNIILLSIKN